MSLKSKDASFQDLDFWIVLANLEDLVRQQLCSGCPSGGHAAVSPPTPVSGVALGWGPAVCAWICLHLPVLPVGAGSVPEGCPGLL